MGQRGPSTPMINDANTGMEQRLLMVVARKTRSQYAYCFFGASYFALNASGFVILRYENDPLAPLVGVSFTYFFL